MLKKIRVEVPHFWFGLKTLQTELLMFKLIIELSSRGIPIYFHEVETDTYATPRTPEKGEIVFSYHSHGNEKNVWRIKETSLRNYYSFEEAGYSGWAAICQDFEKFRPRINELTLEKAKHIIANTRQIFFDTGLSKYEQPEVRKLSLPESYVFFPLQVFQDPVSDFSRFSMIEILEKAAETAKANKIYLVVKNHPDGNRGIQKFGDYLAQLQKNNSYVLVVDENIHSLIENAVAVLTINSGVGFEALVHGKPVYTVGACEWEKATYQITSLEEVREAFSQKQFSLSDFQKKLIAFLISQYWVNIGDEQAFEEKIENCIALFESDYGVNLSENPLQEIFIPTLLDYRKKIDQGLRRERELLANMEFLKKELTEIKKRQKRNLFNRVKGLFK